MTTRIILKNVIGSFVTLVTPKAFEEGGLKKYSMQVLFPKDSPYLSTITNAVSAEAKLKFGSKVNLASIRTLLREGAQQNNFPLEGGFFLNASNIKRPGILNLNGSVASDDDIDAKGYSGCIFHVSINISAYVKGNSKGVTSYLNNVMLVAEGERLDGGKSASADFEDDIKADEGNNFDI